MTHTLLAAAAVAAAKCISEQRNPRLVEEWTVRWGVAGYRCANSLFPTLSLPLCHDERVTPLLLLLGIHTRARRKAVQDDRRNDSSEGFNEFIELPSEGDRKKLARSAGGDELHLHFYFRH